MIDPFVPQATLGCDPTQLNVLTFRWDPTRDTGVFIKVNCISTEFTPKKHGGEKGVPFRLQVETYTDDSGTSISAGKTIVLHTCKIFGIKKLVSILSHFFV